MSGYISLVRPALSLLHCKISGLDWSISPTTKGMWFVIRLNLLLHNKNYPSGAMSSCLITANIITIAYLSHTLRFKNVKCLHYYNRVHMVYYKLTNKSETWTQTKCVSLVVIMYLCLNWCSSYLAYFSLQFLRVIVCVHVT